MTASPPLGWCVAVQLEEAGEELSLDFAAALRRIAPTQTLSKAAIVLCPAQEHVLALATAANRRAAAVGALESPFPWAATGGPNEAPVSDVQWLLIDACRKAEHEHKSSREGTSPVFYVPLHADVDDRACWSAAAWGGLFVDPEPFRRAMGHEAAMYIDFMRHYCVYLALPAALSIVPYVMRVYAHSTALHPLYAIITVIWAVLFVRYWQRRQSDVARDRGLLCDGIALDSVDVGGMKDYVVPDPRKGFRGTPRRNPVTGQDEVYFPSARRKFVLRPLAWLGVAAYMLPCLGLQLLSINLQGYMIHDHASFLRVEALAKWADPGQPFDPNGDGYLYLLPVTLHVCAVLVLGMLFKPVAERLTEFENHRTEDDHRLAFMQKRVVFEFVDCYFLLFFVAFFLMDMNQLRSEFASIFAVDQVRRLMLEAVIPWVMHTAKGGSKWRKKLASLSREEVVKLTAQEALARDEYEAFDDYLEMVVQFGYVAMFASAFPLAATLSWIGNLVEVRADAFKMCFVTRRPMPERAAACKPWTGILGLFATAAVIVNCLLIGVTSNHQLDDYLPAGFSGRRDRLLFGIGLEHVMALVVLALRWAVPATPRATYDHVAAKVWQRQQASRD